MLEERGVISHFFQSKHIFRMEGNLAGLTEKLSDFASLQRSVQCHNGGLEMIYDLIIFSNIRKLTKNIYWQVHLCSLIYVWQTGGCCRCA